MESSYPGTTLAAYVAEKEQILVDDAARRLEAWKTERTAEMMGRGTVATQVELSPPDQE